MIMILINVESDVLVSLCSFSFYLLFICICMYTLVLCICGVALSWTKYTSIKSLVACSYLLSNSESSSSCFLQSNLTSSTACIGTSSSYHTAYECQQTQSQPTSSSSQSTICSCVTDNSSSCQFVTDVPSCHYVLALFPSYLQMNYSLTLVCLILTLCIFGVAIVYGYDIHRLSSSAQPFPETGSTQTDAVIANVPEYYFDPEQNANIMYREIDKPVSTSAQYGPPKSVLILRDDYGGVRQTESDIEPTHVVTASVLTRETSTNYISTTTGTTNRSAGNISSVELTSATVINESNS